MTTRATSTGTVAARGLALMAGGTLIVRAASLVVQLVLARLLLQEDFGLYALTLTVWGFVQLLTNPGLDDVLIARRERLHLWASPAVWMSLALGMLGTLVMCAAAPVAARAYDDPRLVSLVLIMAAGAIPSALMLVPGALIRARLRFKAWALFLVVNQLALYALQVVLAARGLGAMAFVIPIPIVALGSLIWLWLVARPRLHASPQFRRWRYLFGDSITILYTRVVQTVQGQADRVALGFIAAASVTGIYYFAFQFSTQVTRVLASNLHQALFPGLASLKDDPNRQLAGALAAARLVGFIGLPLACLQAALVQPFLHLLFGDKWSGAVFPAQVMSVAMGFDCMAWVSVSLLQANRRFKPMALMFTASCLIYVVLVSIAAILTPAHHAADAVALATGVHFLIVPLFCLIYSVRLAGGTALDALKVYALPTLLAPPSIALAWWIGTLLIPPDRQSMFFDFTLHVPGSRPIVFTDDQLNDLARIGVVTLFAAGIYVAVTLIFARHLWLDLVGRIRLMFARKHAS